MIELVRTNDLVLISLDRDAADAGGRGFFVADQHMSVVEGSLGFLPRRIMVDAERAGAGATADARSRPLRRIARWLRPPGEAPTSLDAILGGRLRLRQPSAATASAPTRCCSRRRRARRRGRSSTSAPGSARSASRCCQRWPEAQGDLVEIDPYLAALARENAALNGLESARARRRGRRARRRAAGAKRAWPTAPPISWSPIRRSSTPDAVRASPDGAPRARARGAARAGDAARRAWIVACLALLAPGGRFVMIHRADALRAILLAIGRRLGGVALLPVHPRAERGAHPAAGRGRQGIEGAARHAPGRSCCTRRPAPSPRAAEAIHRGEATIDWLGMIRVDPRVSRLIGSARENANPEPANPMSPANPDASLDPRNRFRP